MGTEGKVIKESKIIIIKLWVFNYCNKSLFVFQLKIAQLAINMYAYFRTRFYFFVEEQQRDISNIMCFSDISNIKCILRSRKNGGYLDKKDGMG